MKEQLDKVCSWSLADGGRYDTACGTAFEFTFDGIKENDFRFCPFCGDVIQETTIPKAMSHTPSKTG